MLITKLKSLLFDQKPIFRISTSNYCKITNKMSDPQILLLSSSNVHGHEYLEYAKKNIVNVLKSKNVKTILFVPYAIPNPQGVIKKFSTSLNKWGFEVNNILESDPIDAVKSAEAIFVSGGNTFLLLKTLYEKQLIELIRGRVQNDGLIYMGASAGSNVAGMTINCTNDMPIVYPPSFDALQLIPFVINPHYLDPDPQSVHKGETREERILQYHEVPESYHVLGIREGAMIYVHEKKLLLEGIVGARLFTKGEEPIELKPGEDISFLLKQA